MKIMSRDELELKKPNQKREKRITTDRRGRGMDKTHGCPKCESLAILPEKTKIAKGKIEVDAKCLECGHKFKYELNK